jgi:glycosyltransferase involved in cell wall biosynthesis
MAATGDPDDELAREVEVLQRHGVRRVHVLAWRDLDDPDAGGSEVHADQFMQRFVRAGLQVVQRTSAAAGRPELAERGGVRLVRRGGRMDVFPRAVLAELTGRHGHADALVEIWNGVPWLSPVWCRRPHVTFVHHVHGPMWDQILPGPLAALGRTIESRVAPRLYRRSLTLTPSDSTRTRLLQLGMRGDRVRVVANGVDPIFRPGSTRAATPTVLFVGRLAPVKRVELLVDAAAEAKRSVTDLRLVIAGDGASRAAVEHRVAAYGAGSWITLLGQLDRASLVEHYRDAWIVASASLVEGWGLSLAEAAACATPAVATDIDGHRCSVVDGSTGTLVPLEGLATAMVALLRDPVRRTAMGQRAAQRAQAFTWEASALGIATGLRDETLRLRRGTP